MEKLNYIYFFYIFRFKKNFQTLTIYLECVNSIILDCDGTMRCSINHFEWSFPFASKLSMTEELYS